MSNMISFDAFPVSVSRGALGALFVKETPLLTPGFTHPPHFSRNYPRRLAQLHKMSSISTSIPPTSLTLFQAPRLVSGAQATPTRHGCFTL